MEVYNENKAEILTEYDLSKGKLVKDKIVKKYPEIQAKEPVVRYELIKEYPNGGKEFKEVIVEKGVKYQPAHEEEVDVLVYIPYTENELTKINAENEIAELIQWFEEYDNQIKQYERCIRLDIDFDKDIRILDKEANNKQLRIRELREILK